MPNSNRFSNLILPFIVVATVTGLVILQKNQLRNADNSLSRAEILNQNNKQLASLKLLNQLPTNNYRNLIADWIFLDYFQYFGDFQARKVTGYSLIPLFFKEIIRNDPKFVDAYIYLSPANSLYAGRPDKTVALISSGLSSLTPQIKDAYYVWLYKGVDELLFLENASDARRSYQMASRWAAQQDDEDSRRISRSASQTAEFLKNNTVSRAAKIRAWLTLLENAKSDNNLVRFILNKVTALGAKVTISADGSLDVQIPPETNGSGAN